MQKNEFQSFKTFYMKTQEINIFMSLADDVHM
jgi:hypothetical protein